MNEGLRLQRLPSSRSRPGMGTQLGTCWAWPCMVVGKFLLANCWHGNFAGMALLPFAAYHFVVGCLLAAKIQAC